MIFYIALRRRSRSSTACVYSCFSKLLRMAHLFYFCFQVVQTRSISLKLRLRFGDSLLSFLYVLSSLFQLEHRFSFSFCLFLTLFFGSTRRRGCVLPAHCFCHRLISPHSSAGCYNAA